MISFSFGYCEKDKFEESATHKPIGHYGNGFKSGSMRLAKDALVLSVHGDSATACVGLLSQTLCADRHLDTLVLPVMDFTLPSHILALSGTPSRDVLAQWVEPRPRDPMDSMTRGSNQIRSTRKIC